MMQERTSGTAGGLTARGSCDLLAAYLGVRDDPLRGIVAPSATAEGDYARQTRNAAVFIAWVVGIFAALSLIGGLVLGINLIHAMNNSNGGGRGSSNCFSQGGTNTNC
jgi:hypothetical protein